MFIIQQINLNIEKCKRIIVVQITLQLFVIEIG